MKKTLLLLLSLGLLLGSFQLVLAEDCVEVDIELPPTVPAEPGSVATGYFELTNCGDEAATIMLDFDITLIIDFGEMTDTITFELGDIPVLVGAGETISREFRFPVSAAPGTITATICVTATSGTAQADDCATMVVEPAAGSDQSTKVNFMFAAGDGCVEVDLELPDTVQLGAGTPPWAEGYFELTNCGDEVATIELGIEASITIEDVIDTTIYLPGRPVTLGAGETESRTFRFKVPPFSGVYTICVTATSGDAMASSCQTMVVIAAGPTNRPHPKGKIKSHNFPNPFNPTTAIQFSLPSASHVTLEVYNIMGQRVTTLVDSELSVGEHSYDWDGSAQASGVYFYLLQTENGREARKMMLLK